MTLRFKAGPAETLTYALARRERCVNVGEMDTLRTIKDMAANGLCIVGAEDNGETADIGILFDHRNYETVFEWLTGPVNVRRLQITEKSTSAETVVLRRTALSGMPIAALMFGYNIGLSGSTRWEMFRMRTTHNQFDYGWTVIRYLEAVRAGKARGAPVPPLRDRFGAPRHVKLDPGTQHITD